MHVIGDYGLQTICNFHNMKQESWWKRICNIDDLSKSKFKDDYKLILYTHAFSWTICILIPIIIDYYLKIHDSDYLFQWFITIMVIINTYIHSIIDNMKANLNKINLIEDQTIHFTQILITLFLYIIIVR